VTGDASYETARKSALKQSNARSLKNIIIDYKANTSLAIFAEHTTIVRGEPVR